MIDFRKKIRFFDDRSKIDDVLILSGVLWSDGLHALVKVRIDESQRGADPDHDSFELESEPDQPFLFNMQSGKVLNSDFDSWLVENYD